MAHCRVAAAHDIPDRPPIRVSPDDTVEVGDRSSEWPEFVFVTCEAGSGWMPSRYLTAAAGSAVVVTAYDTTELRTVMGERLEILVRDPVSGWTWCRNGRGQEGWVPDRTLDLPFGAE